jgi:uncharacterized protein (TIGR02001 family)
MRTLKLALIAATASLAFAGAAQAQDEEGPVSLSFNAGVTSDYVFRGVSQTDEEVQFFGGVDATLGPIGYAGAWLSNVDFGDGTELEYDLYAGIKPAVGPVTFDLGVIYYGYTNQPSGADWDYWEGKLAASVPAGPATIGAAVYYSPEFTGDTGDAWYKEVNATFTIPETRFSLSGAVGHQSIEEAANYTVWNVGVGVTITDFLGFDVRYWDTDLEGPLTDERVVVGLKAVF